MSCSGSTWLSITCCISDMPPAATTMAVGMPISMPPIALNGLVCNPMKTVRFAIGPPFLRGCLEVNRNFLRGSLGQWPGSSGVPMVDGATRALAWALGGAGRRRRTDSEVFFFILFPFHAIPHPRGWCVVLEVLEAWVQIGFARAHWRVFLPRRSSHFRPIASVHSRSRVPLRRAFPLW